MMLKTSLGQCCAQDVVVFCILMACNAAVSRVVALLFATEDNLPGTSAGGVVQSVTNHRKHIHVTSSHSHSQHCATCWQQSSFQQHMCRPPPDSSFSSEGNRTLPRIRTVPEEEPMSDIEPASSSEQQSSQPQQSFTAPASLSHNWRFSPVNSPVGSPVDAGATARSEGTGWRRSGSLRRTASSDGGAPTADR